MGRRTELPRWGARGVIKLALGSTFTLFGMRFPVADHLEDMLVVWTWGKGGKLEEGTESLIPALTS